MSSNPQTEFDRLVERVEARGGEIQTDFDDTKFAYWMADDPADGFIFDGDGCEIFTVILHGYLDSLDHPALVQKMKDSICALTTDNEALNAARDRVLNTEWLIIGARSPSPYKKGYQDALKHFADVVRREFGVKDEE